MIIVNLAAAINFDWALKMAIIILLQLFDDNIIYISILPKHLEVASYWIPIKRSYSKDVYDDDNDDVDVDVDDDDVDDADAVDTW